MLCLLTKETDSSGVRFPKSESSSCVEGDRDVEMHMNQYLIVRCLQPENSHGLFTREILISEGMMGFHVVDLDAVGLPLFESGDLVLLTRCSLRTAECEALYSAVERGVRLVCLQPPTGLAKRFGLVSTAEVLHPGWIRIRQGHPGSRSPIQAHVPIALNEASGWDVLADAVSTDWVETGFPAVAMREVGAGKVAFFFYDLSLAVARIRFGNPDLASHCTTGIWHWLHAMDLFTGHVDGRVRDIPQADFHGQLLAWVLTDLCAVPLMRLWYYPRISHRSAAVFQSDDDGSTVAQFRELSDSLVKHSASGTFYLMRDTLMTESDVSEFRALGHTFAPHANPFNSQEEIVFSFPEALREETGLFQKRFGKCSRTLQCHCAPWKGYMDWVPMFVESGYRLLFAYLSAPISFLNGFMCGSGRPMCFFGLDSKQHDCWQQPVLIYDDTTVRDLISEKGLDEILASQADLIERTIQETHTAIGILSHPVSFATYSRPFIERGFDLLQQHNVPIFNGDQWLDFLQRRSRVQITLHDSHDEGLLYDIQNLDGTMTLMVPSRQDAKDYRITMNDVLVDGFVERRMEQDYLLFEIEGSGERLTICVREDA